MRAAITLVGLLGCAALALSTACGTNDGPSTPTPTPTATPTVTPTPEIASPDPARFRIGATLFEDDFASASGWRPELQGGGVVAAVDGSLVIDVPSGCTVWYRDLISAPVMIEYSATVVRAGGPNDRASDLNCWWMARDARSPSDVFGTARGGDLSEYDRLTAYYLSIGGNDNTTTRFRRYVGEDGVRPLLGELSGAEELISPNVEQKVQLVVLGSYVAVYVDGRRYFEYTDASPYDSGWFALRTICNHMTVHRFRAYRISQP